jgi:hypothetical protein
MWIIIFFCVTFENGDGKIFKLLRWKHNLHQSTWDNEILYANRSSKDKQHLLSEISGSHGGEYEAGSFLGCSAM